MSEFLYNLFLKAYQSAITIVSPFNNKAKQWIEGRKNQTIECRTHEQHTIWVHCASVGEFEQAKPIIELISKIAPQYSFVLTFFSPSGYNACKQTTLVDKVYYLPMDGKENAHNFIECIKPEIAIFIKYEFWHYYLSDLKSKEISTFLVSGIFRKEQPFFKRYGQFFRKILNNYTALFIQDNESQTLLHHINISNNVFVTGDTRYDRVANISDQIVQLEIIENFLGNSKCIIAGSTWPEDEKTIASIIENLPQDWKLILAPHEIHQEHLSFINQLFKGNVVFYSDYQPNNKKVLVIDNIGLLSKIYRYGTIAYIGGGFNKSGIHNSLEAAIYGLPVIFGPHYKKFNEAKHLVKNGYAKSITNSGELLSAFQHYNNALDTTNISEQIKVDTRNKTGASQKIVTIMKEHFWLK